MTNRHTPPALKSNALVVVRKPSGPHHCERCFGSVHTDHTSSRGALTSRVPTITFGSESRSTLLVAATLLLLLFRGLPLRRFRLQRAEIILQPIEPLLPEPAIFLEPVVDALQRIQLDPARPPLRLAAAGDQARVLQHLEMPGDRRSADVEWLRQFRDRGLAKRQPRQDRPAGRVGQSLEGRAEVV